MAERVHRFAAFELDCEARSLRLGDDEIPLQPRVFDLLVYLVENRQRVVGKDELFDALWPGVIVTESSLQRAVSLARTALQQGGLGKAIRSYARRGYRFQCDEATTEAAPASSIEPTANASSEDSPEALLTAQQWPAAMRAYAQRDREAGLDAEALERWAMAAQCAGDLAAAIAPLERAAIAYSSRGLREAAARVTIALARIQLESMDVAVTQGCLRRAERLLASEPVGEQHGALAWMSARLCLSTGDHAAAVRHAERARELGQRLRSVDLESMGLLMAGIGLQARGETIEGLAQQNEAAASVLAGDVSPLIGGIVYCGVIASCANSGDWLRAEQWTERFTHWCLRNHIDTFAGACLIHRAEVMVNAGRLQEASAAILEGDAVVRSGAPWAVGEGYRLLGDVQLARGDEDAAALNYSRAHQYGWNPNPGYAQLLHQRGRSEDALSALRDATELCGWISAERRARYQVQAALIAAQSGRREEARRYLQELDAAPESWASGAIAGMVNAARGELCWIDDSVEEALRYLRIAADLLSRQRAVIDAALVRLRLAEMLFVQRQALAAELELQAAEAAFIATQASGFFARCSALRETATPKAEAMRAGS